MQAALPPPPPGKHSIPAAVRRWASASREDVLWTMNRRLRPVCERPMKNRLTCRKLAGPAESGLVTTDMKAERAPVSLAPAPGSGRLLVVDDDPDVWDSLERALRHAGYAVTTAVHGADALNSVARSPGDLIVLDPGSAWLGSRALHRAPGGGKRRRDGAGRVRARRGNPDPVPPAEPSRPPPWAGRRCYRRGTGAGILRSQMIGFALSGGCGTGRTPCCRRIAATWPAIHALPGAVGCRPSCARGNVHPAASGSMMITVRSAARPAATIARSVR